MSMINAPRAGFAATLAITGLSLAACDRQMESVPVEEVGGAAPAMMTETANTPVTAAPVAGQEAALPPAQPQRSTMTAEPAAAPARTKRPATAVKTPPAPAASPAATPSPADEHAGHDMDAMADHDGMEM